MARKAKRRTTATPKVSVAKEHRAALERHARALQAHSNAMSLAAAAQSANTAALRNHTAVLAATKPQKTFNQKTADATDCMSQWLMRAKGVSKADSINPGKNMTTDFHIGAPQEMQLCLEWVQGCLSTKGDFYHLDTTSPNANQHLIKLMGGTLGDVVADIVSNMS